MIKVLRREKIKAFLGYKDTCPECGSICLKKEDITQEIDLKNKIIINHDKYAECLKCGYGWYESGGLENSEERIVRKDTKDIKKKSTKKGSR